VREIRTLRAMWRGLETTYGSDTEALSTETERKQTRPNFRSIGANPPPYRRGWLVPPLSRLVMSVLYLPASALADSEAVASPNRDRMGHLQSAISS
jgi:hypothetical protein